MACRTGGKARIAGLVFAWLQIVVRSLLWLVIGVGLLLIYPFILLISRTVAVNSSLRAVSLSLSLGLTTWYLAVHAVSRWLVF